MLSSFQKAISNADATTIPDIRPTVTSLYAFNVASLSFLKLIPITNNAKQKKRMLTSRKIQIKDDMLITSLIATSLYKKGTITRNKNPYPLFNANGANANKHATFPTL